RQPRSSKSCLAPSEWKRISNACGKRRMAISRWSGDSTRNNFSLDTSGQGRSREARGEVIPVNPYRRDLNDGTEGAPWSGLHAEHVGGDTEGGDDSPPPPLWL